ncbi:MAG TPA: hypothetical protein VN843_20745 [Anaerolineales bacterium]|nr:hypothetical protein [Anaerolineales bacterium]
MIEAVQIPILLKAIDFVFDEGRKILDERRERRKANETPQDSKSQEPAGETAPPEMQEQAEVKQDLIASKIDEILWQKHEEDVKHLVKLLEKHTKNYYILKEQSAQWGSALVPPVIMLQLEEKENAIIETRKQLEIVLSKVYKKDINPV